MCYDSQFGRKQYFSGEKEINFSDHRPSSSRRLTAEENLIFYFHFYFLYEIRNEITRSIISEFIIQSLSPEDYRYVMKTVESAILSTDLAMYFKKRDTFLNLIDNGEFDFSTTESKDRKFFITFSFRFCAPLVVHLTFGVSQISCSENECNWESFHFNKSFYSPFSLLLMKNLHNLVLCGMMMTACDVS